MILAPTMIRTKVLVSLLIPGCVTLGRSCHLSEPVFPAWEWHCALQPVVAVTRAGGDREWSQFGRHLPWEPYSGTGCCHLPRPDLHFLCLGGGRGGGVLGKPASDAGFAPGDL